MNKPKVCVFGVIYNEKYLLPYIRSDKYITGFSNTAIRTDKFYYVNFPEDIKVVDKYFFAPLKNLKIAFTNNTVTYYRRYNNTPFNGGW